MTFQSLLPRRALLVFASTLPFASLPAHSAPRALMLAKVYHDGITLADYRVSEKYDGVRAYWDGHALWTRHGHRIHAPAWFTAGWPAHALDGELWAGLGRYTAAASAAARDVPDNDAWRSLRYMAFDLPAHPGSFDERAQALAQLLRPASATTAQPVQLRRVPDHASLQALLRETVQAGGEGLMLHRGAAPYRAERSNDLLKLKEQLDAEATVIGHLPGKGRHQGRVGALLVQTPQGLRFRLGSGLSDAERDRAPALGSQVTYRYSGLHPNGAPRFASFVRLRAD
jgi:DNA ligase-1